ncbi:uncharacterized protein LOC115891368 [Sitophilus oryzae]|uniref:Uncharacterized protein LOC115891368 n=1 Tax=Sitophilus oryzae TaxID=7048 RepID=A0A6J2YWQ7_SITOR|nr:uncharacterized protein LOC115891368 [Sitophilus oryzae]
MGRFTQRNRHNHSAEDALVKLTRTINDSLDSGEKVLSVFVDLVKAFDTVDHGKLIEILENSADPNFHLSKPVDIHLGADIYGFLITGNKLLSDPDQPVALETIFGWIITGRVKTSSVSLSVNSYFLTSYASLDQSLQRFWELEDVPQSSTLSSDEKLAEEHFCKTFSRTLSGRYKVSLPFKTLEPIFEGSRDVALRRFFSLEKRLLRNPQLYSQYSNYMREYLDSQYMIAVQNPSPNAHSYYLPHHCVIRPDSLTTKLRVVFDASARDYTNKSLNDTLLTGPKLQSDILSILLRFRSHLIVFASDINKCLVKFLLMKIILNT